MIRRLGPVGILERLSRANYTTLFLLWVFVNLVCTAFYFAMTQWMPERGPTIDAALPPMQRLWQSAYFSLVTITTTGYGDIVPLGVSRAVAVTESAAGVLILGILMAKLVARHTDEVVSDVHRLSFESVFYHIRQGLFIVRRDLEGLLREAEHNGTLSTREWENLSAGYLQAQSLLEELPSFYVNNNAYVIDAKRESLMIDSVQRTVSGALHLLEAFDRKGIDWRGHAQSFAQLRVLADNVDAVMAVWKNRSPHRTIEAHELPALQARLRAAVGA
jgi:hypothetical protein